MLILMSDHASNKINDNAKRNFGKSLENDIFCESWPP